MEGLAPEFLDDFHGLFLRSGITVLCGFFLGLLLHVALDESGPSHSHPLPPAVAAPSAAVAERNCEGTRSDVSLDSSVHTSRREGGAAADKAGVGFETGRGRGSDRTTSMAFSDTPSYEVEAGPRVSNGDAKNGSVALHAPAVGHRVECGEGERACSSVDRTGVVAPASRAPGSLYDLTGASKGHGVFDVKGLDPVCWNIIVGDLAHKFADGVTMGAAFFGLLIDGGVDGHGGQHDARDPALVNGGMVVTQALLYTFTSALSAVVGVLVTLDLRGLMITETILYFLMIGSGTFIFVGLAELVPGALGESSVVEKGWRLREQLKRVVTFAFGAALLGLPLLAHPHCESHGHVDHR